MQLNGITLSRCRTSLILRRSRSPAATQCAATQCVAASDLDRLRIWQARHEQTIRTVWRDATVRYLVSYIYINFIHDMRSNSVA